jgi:4a-hydroxytetrahydrobiopterin dehydratase
MTASTGIPDTVSGLRSRRCTPRTGDPLGKERTQELFPQIAGWSLTEDGGAIRRTFAFRNYYETIAFVNAVAWVVHREDHHPDLEVGYNRCTVHFSTHSVHGLSENDFICAAKIDAILGE